MSQIHLIIKKLENLPRFDVTTKEGSNVVNSIKDSAGAWIPSSHIHDLIVDLNSIKDKDPINTLKHDRYMIFCGETRYPFGGMRDFYDSYESLKEAINTAITWTETCGFHSWWIEVYDSHYDEPEDAIVFKNVRR